MFFLLLAVVLSELHEIMKKRLELQKKVDRRICVREMTFLAAHPSSYVIFCWSNSSLLSIPILRGKKGFVSENVGGYPLPPPSAYGPVAIKDGGREHCMAIDDCVTVPSGNNMTKSTYNHGQSILDKL